MNATQLKAIREMWESANQVSQVFTAKEIQFESGKWINSDLFYHADGRKFVWVESKQVYCSYN